MSSMRAGLVGHLFLYLVSLTMYRTRFGVLALTVLLVVSVAVSKVCGVGSATPVYSSKNTLFRQWAVKILTRFLTTMSLQRK